MERLSYQTLHNIGYQGYLLPQASEKVMQFGEGNFLRAFVDYWFDLANEKTGFSGKCVIIKPIEPPSPVARMLNEQEGLYTLCLRGQQGGKTVDRRRVISSVSRCLDPYTPEGFREMMKLAVSEDLRYIVSNTTEAGIRYDPACRPEDTPCSSFPGKLTQVLSARQKAGKPGVILLPCELNDHNGALLYNCVLKYAEQWELGEEFIRYLREECLFCSTLVDRIVPGSPRDPAQMAELERKNGYRDPLLDVGEVFGVWNIEGPEWLGEELPFRRAGLSSVSVVPDVTPYKMRKVRILNGAHTGFVPGAYLAGFDIVRDCMKNKTVLDFMNKMLYEEVIPTLPLPKDDLTAFAGAVKDRFDNPFIDHALLSITLNSTAKWRERNLPSLMAYVEKFHSLPPCLTLSFAAYLAFYGGNIEELSDEGLLCRRPGGSLYTVKDDRPVLEFFASLRGQDPGTMVRRVLQNTSFWGQDLTGIEGFETAVLAGFSRILKDGAQAAFADCL